MRDNVLDLSEFTASNEFACPRCGATTSARFYGPCSVCVDGLRAALAGEPGRASDAAEYEPKMNVTPNAVALKDD